MTEDSGPKAEHICVRQVAEMMVSGPGDLNLAGLQWIPHSRHLSALSECTYPSFMPSRCPAAE